MRLSTRLIFSVVFVTAAVNCSFCQDLHDIPQIIRSLQATPPSEDSFDVQATVLFCCSRECKAFAVTDGTNCVHLIDMTHWPRLVMSDNDVIRAKGHIVACGNADCTSIEVIGKASPTHPNAVSISAVNKGLFNQRLVRVRGTVRSAVRDEIDPLWAVVTIADDESSLQATIKPSEDDFPHLRSLAGSRVSVLGIPTLPNPFSVNHDSRRFSPIVLSVGSLSRLTVLTPAPKDPFQAPDIFTASFTLYSGLQNKRHVAAGHVLAVFDSNKVVMQTLQGEIFNVSLSQDALPALGKYVKVVGYPTTDLYRISLTDALWKYESGPAFKDPQPEDISLVDLLTDGKGHTMIKPNCHGRKVRFRGFVRTMPGSGDSDGRILLEADGLVMPIDVRACPQVLDGLSQGCLAEVVGTCVMPTESWHWNTVPPRIRSVFVALRQATDLRIIRTPPWWTPQRLLILVATLVAGLAVILFWNLLLKRRVEQRSHALLDEQIAHVTSDLKTMERTRLAIELHDSLAQNLTGVALQLQTVKEFIHEDADRADEHLEAANRSLLSCREELRNCLRDLRSEALETPDVNQAIRLTLDPHVGNADVAVRFSVPREMMTDNTLHAVLRIIRELVLNAIRHGHATSVKVAGAIKDNRLLFSVSDNGCGFDPRNRPGPREGHFGLQGIRERINGFNGTFEIESKEGHGTKATLAILLPQEDSSCKS